jgi:hypothetical protein
MSKLIEFPTSIDRQRVVCRAWTWFNGCGTDRIPVFADALRESWKHEKAMIKSGGTIYYPYILFNHTEGNLHNLADPDYPLI